MKDELNDIPDGMGIPGTFKFKVEVDSSVRYIYPASVILGIAQEALDKLKEELSVNI